MSNLIFADQRRVISTKGDIAGRCTGLIRWLGSADLSSEPSLLRMVRSTNLIAYHASSEGLYTAVDELLYRAASTVMQYSRSLKEPALGALQDLITNRLRVYGRVEGYSRISKLAFDWLEGGRVITPDGSRSSWPALRLDSNYRDQLMVEMAIQKLQAGMAVEVPLSIRDKPLGRELRQRSLSLSNVPLDQLKIESNSTLKRTVHEILVWISCGATIHVDVIRLVTSRFIRDYEKMSFVCPSTRTLWFRQLAIECRDLELNDALQKVMEIDSLRTKRMVDNNLDEMFGASDQVASLELSEVVDTVSEMLSIRAKKSK